MLALPLAVAGAGLTAAPAEAQTCGVYRWISGYVNYANCASYPVNVTYDVYPTGGLMNQWSRKSVYIRANSDGYLAAAFQKVRIVSVMRG